MLAKTLRPVSSLVQPAWSSRSKHTLPDLPYDYNALEPVISAEIMQLHHSKVYFQIGEDIMINFLAPCYLCQ